MVTSMGGQYAQAPHSSASPFQMDGRCILCRGDCASCPYNIWSTAMNDQVDAPPKPVDMEKRCDQYLKLRTIKQEIEERHKQELAPIKKAMDDVAVELASGLDQANAESVKTACGTVHFTTKQSASVSDMTAFWTFVTTTGQWELLDKKANVTAVRDFIDNNNGQQPPGVNYSAIRTVGVRKPTDK